MHQEGTTGTKGLKRRPSHIDSEATDIITPKDITKNRLLLLALLTEVSKNGKVYGIVKEQKVTHALQRRLRDKDRSGLTYTFVKDNLGPRSTGVYHDVDALVSSGFWSDEKHKPTPEGKRLIERLQPVLESGENREIWETIVEAALEYGPLSPDDCRKLAYEYDVSLPGGAEIPMSEVTKGTVVLRPNRGGKTLYLPKTELHTLRFQFDPDARAQLKMAAERCQTEEPSSRPWREVLG